MFESIRMLGEVKAISYGLDGNILKTSEGSNIIVNSGKVQLLSNLFIQASSGLFPFLAVGASGINQGFVASASDTHLIYEINTNTVRKPFLSVNGGALTSADITNENVTIGGFNFTEKLVGQATFPQVDNTNGYQFGEYALASIAPVPGTPTGTSGQIFNHYLDPNPLNKQPSNTIVVQVTIRF
jgi:hypothetical protein